MDDVVIFLSPANHRLAVRAAVAANQYHYSFGDGQGDFYLPGTNAKLVKSSGLVGNAGMFAMPSKYAIFATGLMSDEENIRLPYDPVSDSVKLRAYYRRGIGFYSVDQMAKNGTL